MSELEMKENLRQFGEYVVSILRPSLIRDFMTAYLDKESVERVLSEESVSLTSAAQMLLDAIFTLQARGWFQALLDALHAAGYTGLHAALTDWDFKELEGMRPNKRLLELIEPSITKQLKPSEVLLYMVDCFSKRESEEIRAMEVARGHIAASEMLTACLKRSDKPHCFKLLKMALHHCKLDNALELLDPPEGSGEDVEASKGNSESMTTESMPTLCIEYREEGEGDDALLKSTNQMSLSDLHNGIAEVVGEQSERSGQRSGEKRLREYQRELAADAFSGINTIICAPTGCGKTVVAVAICEHHLRARDRAKIVFMATKVDVYAQQLKLFKEHFLHTDPDIRIAGMCGDMDSLPLSELTESNDIVVLTPQILVNALHYGQIASLATFTLLIFDECHNTTGKHPYNIIMTRYLDNKLSNNSTALPQVVGLTASVGIGSFKSQTEAESNICQLCANLDARVITTVTQHREELRSYVHTPEKEFSVAPQRSSDPFIIIIINIMMQVERLAQSTYDIASLSGFQTSERGSQKYEQWIVDVQKRCRVLQLTDPQEESRVCRALYNYTEHLRKYNDALIINEDARTKDALQYLDAFFQQVRKAGFDETEKKLTGFYDAQREQLLCLTTGGQHENPKLAELMFILDEAYRNNDQTRTVLFVRTRALADALRKWIEETDSLKFLKPGVLIGRSRKSQLTGPGMTLTSKQGVLESFKRSDESKILIATSVADEGIDIPQCNLVLMYEYVGNVVKMVQVRGRGRAEGSKCFLISSQEERVNKEKLNMYREKMVEKAISSLQASPTAMHAKIDVLQKGDKAMREFMSTSPEKPRSHGTFQLLCAKCKNPACFTDDLRVLQDSHHIVLGGSFLQRCVTEPHPQPKRFGNFRKNEKLHCKQCQHDWGIVASYLTIQALPVLKIESFVVLNCITQKQLYFRKWRDVTFSLKPFDLTEMSLETTE